MSSPATGLAGTAVGLEIGPVATTLDARWLMAYAAAVGAEDPRFFDTGAPAGPAAHPVFAVCYEWPALVAIREKVVPPALASRGVHATHRLIVHRPPRAGDSLFTTARITQLTPRAAGTLLVVELVTVDRDGTPVTTTEHGSVFRGVPTDVPSTREPRNVATDVPAAPPGGPDGSADVEAGWSETIPIAASAAHVYTECARIWNPIHTDIAVARAAGLPGLILHGTATLALAVSRIVAREFGGDPGRVREVGVRFTGMVRLPSLVSVHVQRHGGVIGFRAADTVGAAVLSEGVVRS
jgi:acyl dehydratase